MTRAASTSLTAEQIEDFLLTPHESRVGTTILEHVEVARLEKPGVSIYVLASRVAVGRARRAYGRIAIATVGRAGSARSVRVDAEEARHVLGALEGALREVERMEARD